MIDPDFLWRAAIGGMLALGLLAIRYAQDDETFLGGVAALVLAAALATWGGIGAEAPRHERGAPVEVRR